MAGSTQQLALLLMAVVCSLHVWQAQAVYSGPNGVRPQGARRRFATHQIIVKKRGQKPQLVNIANPGGSDAAVRAAVRKAAGERGVAYAEPNVFLYAARVPNDPSYATQQWHLPAVGAPAAWDKQYGNAKVTVCVVDSGIKYNHPDLSGDVKKDAKGVAIGASFNVTNPGNYAPGFDDMGHGSHVAGIIGAYGNNAAGVAGINWRVSLISAKFLDSDGSGTAYGASLAIDWCNSQNATVISMSAAGDDSSQTMADSIARSNALFFAAAGNDNSSTPVYPAGFSLAPWNLPNVVSVAATQKDDSLAGFSNYGPSWVHIAAPGQSIYSTYGNPYFTSMQYIAMSGTSMATPLVSGAVALAYSQRLTFTNKPPLTLQQMKNLLLQTVDVVPALNGKVSTGGRLNVTKLINGVGTI